jgi:hypothetical protein
LLLTCEFLRARSFSEGAGGDVDFDGDDTNAPFSGFDSIPNHCGSNGIFPVITRMMSSPSLQPLLVRLKETSSCWSHQSLFGIFNAIIQSNSSPEFACLSTAALVVSRNKDQDVHFLFGEIRKCFQDKANSILHDANCNKKSIVNAAAGISIAVILMYTDRYGLNLISNQCDVICSIVPAKQSQGSKNADPSIWGLKKQALLVGYLLKAVLSLNVSVQVDQFSAKFTACMLEWLQKFPTESELDRLVFLDIMKHIGGLKGKISIEDKELVDRYCDGSDEEGFDYSSFHHIASSDQIKQILDVKRLWTLCCKISSSTTGPDTRNVQDAHNTVNQWNQVLRFLGNILLGAFFGNFRGRHLSPAAKQQAEQSELLCSLICWENTTASGPIRCKKK